MLTAVKPVEVSRGDVAVAVAVLAAGTLTEGKLLGAGGPVASGVLMEEKVLGDPVEVVAPAQLLGDAVSEFMAGGFPDAKAVPNLGDLAAAVVVIA